MTAKDLPAEYSTDALYLVDVSSFIFRAYYAIRNLTNRKGEPVNAIYGVATMLARLIEEAKPRYISIVYDSKEPSFRKLAYDAYKANRSAAPDDLVPQFDRIEQLIESMGFHSIRRSVGISFGRRKRNGGGYLNGETGQAMDARESQASIGVSDG